MTPESRGSQDLLTYLRIFWRWKFLFLFFLVIFPLGAYLIERGKPKVYESSTLVSLRSYTLPGAAPAPGATSLDAVARIVTTTPIARKAALLLNPPGDPHYLLDEVKATSDPTTGFLSITVDDHNPQRAAQIATAFARAIGSYQSAQQIQQINQQIAQLNRQLSRIPPTDPGRAPVTNQIATLSAQRSTLGSGVQVIQPAAANPNPVGPKTHRAVEIGLVIGLLLAIGAVLTAESSDRRLRTPEDLENLTDMRLLGVVPRTAFSPDRLNDPAVEESFQMVRAALSYFSVDRPLKSVAIISPLVGDGKTTVATGLAVAAARAGKNVILVDADLRRPQVFVRLGLDEADGLGGVLAGDRELEDVLTEHDVGAPEGGQLKILQAGPPPANPSALISSQNMRDVLRRLEDNADLVVVDTAASLAVSDSIPLVQSASAIAIIVRMNRSSSAAVRRLQKVIASAEGNPMGVVATGQPPAGGYGKYYNYRYHYVQNGNGTQAPRILGGLRRRKARRRNGAAAATQDVAAPTRKTNGESQSNGARGVGEQAHTVGAGENASESTRSDAP